MNPDSVIDDREYCAICETSNKTIGSRRVSTLRRWSLIRYRLYVLMIILMLKLSRFVFDFVRPGLLGLCQWEGGVYNVLWTMCCASVDFPTASLLHFFTVEFFRS